MNNIIFLIFTLFLIGCGKQYAPVVHDKNILPYTQEFTDASQSYGVNSRLSRISLKFSNIPESDVLGQCIIYTKKDALGVEYEYGRTIEISTKWWNVSTESERSQLLTHELGHCSLNRDHRVGYIESRYGGTIRLSLMNPYRLQDEEYTEYLKYYLEELFRPKVNSIEFIASMTDSPTSDYAVYASKSDTFLTSMIEHNHNVHIDHRLEKDPCVKVVNVDEEKTETEEMEEQEQPEE